MPGGLRQARKRCRTKTRPSGGVLRLHSRSLPLAGRGLLVILEAKPGKAEELGAFLAQAQPLASAEPGTVTWYAFKLSDTTYGIFDTFAGEDGRQAHLNGPIAAALGQAAPDLLAKDPDIQTTDILAAK